MCKDYYSNTCFFLQTMEINYKQNNYFISGIYEMLNYGSYYLLALIASQIKHTIRYPPETVASRIYWFILIKNLFTKLDDVLNM